MKDALNRGDKDNFQRLKKFGINFNYMRKTCKFECPLRLILKILKILNTFSFLISLFFRYEGVRCQHSSAKGCLRDLAFSYLNSGKL